MTKFRANPWAVLLVVSLGFFMTLLDLTIVNIAIPNMIVKLHASLDDVLWVLNAYALVLAVLVITAGRLGDLIGPRTMFAVGITVFTAASAACGFAPGAGWLIAFRAVQGLGAAMLMPQTLAIVTMTFPPERRGAAFGVWGAVAGLATVAGPTLGGLLVSAFDWRWIFFVNLPIGAVVLAVTFVIIPKLQPGRRHRFDILGVGLASLALLAICYGLVEGQRYNWDGGILLSIAVGVALLGVFLVAQKLRQDREPLIPFVLFRDRNYTLMNWVSFTLSIGMLGIFLPFTIYLQDALGFSALKAGLTMAPSSLVMIVAAPFLGRLTDKTGGKHILIGGLSLFAVGMGWAVLIAGPHSSWQDFLAPLIVAGLGMGGTFAPMTTVAMREVDPRMAGAASGMLNTVRQVGSVIGTASVGALLQNRLAAELGSQAVVKSAALPPQARGPFIAGIQHSAASGLIGGPASGGTGGTGGTGTPGVPAALQAELRRLAGQVFSQGYVLAMRWTMVMPIAVVVLAAASCFAIRSRASAQDQPTAPQMAGTINSPGPSGSLARRSWGSNGNLVANTAPGPAGRRRGKGGANGPSRRQRRAGRGDNGAHESSPTAARHDSTRAPCPKEHATDDAAAPAGDPQSMPTIAVDAMGGDYAPGEIIAGALAARREHGIRILLTGPAARLRQELTRLGADPDADGLGVVPAEDAPGMGEGALATLRRPRSSVAVACQLVRRGDAAAVVSAGSTGGVVATARLRLRSLPGVLRPGLAVVLPTRPGRTVLIDAGATADPKPEMLVQFGQLGVAYSQLLLGVTAPRVGLLTIGTEPGKGNNLTRRAHELLAADPPNGALPLRFAGNVEGGDLLASELDVIVTDGFTGNVALKTLEGSIRFATAELRAAMTGTPAARFGAFLQRRGLRQLSTRLDAESYGGAVLLGLGGTVVIAHGASTARAVTSACLLAANLARGQITEKITQRLGPGRPPRTPSRSGHFLRRPSADR